MQLLSSAPTKTHTHNDSVLGTENYSNKSYLANSSFHFSALPSSNWDISCLQWSSVQFSHSVVSDSLQPHDCSTPGLPVIWEFTQTHVHWVIDAIQPSHPLLSISPSAFNLSSIRVFSNESDLCTRWPKYWSFSFSISPSNEYLGLILYRMDWFDLITGQETLKSLLQHQSSKESII